MHTTSGCYKEEETKFLDRLLYLADQSGQTVFSTPGVGVHVVTLSELSLAQRMSIFTPTDWHVHAQVLSAGPGTSQANVLMTYYKERID